MVLLRDLVVVVAAVVALSVQGTMGLWARSRAPRTLVVAWAGVVLVGPLMERLALALLVFLWGVLEELWLVLQAAVVEVRQAHGALAALGQQEGHLPMP